DGSEVQLAEEAEKRGIPVIIMTAYAFRFGDNLLRFEVLLKPVRPASCLWPWRTRCGRRDHTKASQHPRRSRRHQLPWVVRDGRRRKPAAKTATPHHRTVRRPG